MKVVKGRALTAWQLFEGSGFERGPRVHKMKYASVPGTEPLLQKSGWMGAWMGHNAHPCTSVTRENRKAWPHRQAGCEALLPLRLLLLPLLRAARSACSA